jgi:hypothetical protein
LEGGPPRWPDSLCFRAGIAKLLIRAKGPCRHVPGLHDEFMQSAQAFSAFTRERLKSIFQPMTDEANFFGQ